VKTKNQLLKITLKDMGVSEGFKKAVVELLADIRNLFIAAFLSDDPNSKAYKSVYNEMKRLLTQESKDKGNKS